MARNQKIILDKVLEERRINLAPTMSEEDFFEVFAATELLKDYDVSYKEIMDGIVDGGDDGGIDSFYTFVNGDLAQEDSNFNILIKDVSIEVVIIQSKTSGGFTETVIDKLIATSTDIFDLSKNPFNSSSITYNKDLVAAVEIFHKVYTELSPRFPKLKVSYYIATKTEETSIHPKVLSKSMKLKTVVRDSFSSVEPIVNFLGAAELLELARQTQSTTHTITLAETPISPAQNDVGEAYIALVKLLAFKKFLTDTSGKLMCHIFEANVRDYQGQVSVNQQIQDTLQNPKKEDFWWLNNGVTILASKVNLSSRILTIESPEIVNGLQTSREIFDYFSENPGEAVADESRTILIRVIVPADTESRYNIIRATNSQTSIAPASLRATDKIHRDIEDYLRSFGLYYDRRKNFYKNVGKPIKSIIGILQIAQAVEAILLQRPDTARARPSSLIKEDEDYDRIFNPEYPIELYRYCVETIKATEDFLHNLPASEQLAKADKNDLKYYIAMIVTRYLTKATKPNAQDIADLAGKSIEASNFAKAFGVAKKKYVELGGNDQAAKGPSMLTNIQKELTQGKLF